MEYRIYRWEWQDRFCLQGGEGVGRGGIGDQPAGQGFHGDKAHVRLFAGLHQLQLLLPGEVAEGELQRLVQAGLDGLVGHGQPVVGDADMADLTLALCLQRRVVEAALIPGPGTEGRVVELIDIHIVRPQVFEGGLQIPPKALRVLGVRLGGDDDLVPDPVQRLAQLYLAVRVPAGRVVKIDPRVIGHAHEADRLRLGNALDRQRAEAVFAYVQSRAAQCDSVHFHPPLAFIFARFWPKTAPHGVFWLRKIKNRKRDIAR